MAGCAGLPGRDFPRPAPMEVQNPPSPTLTQPFLPAARQHEGASGFRLYSLGIDGLLLRLELIAQAKSSLDLQYYIFHGDESGRLITEALLQAAQRGVRVRIVVDDAETAAGDEQLFALVGANNVSIRIFNPWRYRGHNRFMRGLEFTFNKKRLDYRMHNKLFIADGAVALVGGRNIGDQYFQVDPDSQFADDDVFAAGPVADELARTFDEYWNSGLAIPAAALIHGRTPPVLAAPTSEFDAQIASGEPYAGMMSGRLPLVWAHAQVVCDSPDKKQVAGGDLAGRLMNAAVLNAAAATRSELLMVTP